MVFGVLDIIVTLGVFLGSMLLITHVVTGILRRSDLGPSWIRIASSVAVGVGGGLILGRTVLTVLNVLLYA